MPTTRPRFFVTETDELAAALDVAATRWPGLSRSQLLVRLAMSGAALAESEELERRERRVRAVAEHAGMFTGLYPPDYLDELREDWPT